MVKQVEEPTYNKWALISIGALIVVIAFAAVMYQQGYNAGKAEMTAKIDQAVSDAIDEVSESEETAADTTSSEDLGYDVSPEIEPVTFSGYGNQETKPIKLKSGLYDVKLTHDGSSNFIVWTVNYLNTKLDYIVNEIGPYDKLDSVHIVDDGEYTFDITASGNWTMTISTYSRA